MNSPIADAAQALAGLLRAAEDGDLPLPFSAEALNYAESRHPAQVYDRGSINLQVHTLDELTDWSTWLNEPIDDTAEPTDGRIHCHLFGMAGPVPVRVTALVPVAEQVSS